MNTPSGITPPRPPPSATEREARIARETAALRDNLRKRKNQARAQKLSLEKGIPDSVAAADAPTTLTSSKDR